jgi:hypothetical protein
MFASLEVLLTAFADGEAAAREGHIDGVFEAGECEA